ncbi:NF-kappa-B-repressing factor [Drosophila nasuta]|uniref:NF-kappa-B-repressing factor n=1 Tax=Drosophila nasuta TaxID=42062 RepID=UPI00295F5AF2|nr:NF-kappa-B-repressing factor [Drosophila nasuta]
MATIAKRQKVEDVEQLETSPTSQKQGKKHKKSKKPSSAENAAENSGDWDVDDYKTEYESEEHWELRRDFMLAHKDRFDEERLVCLAQTFINMEFMGCKYPNETMLLVAELSKDIAEEFRKNRALRLKRTFVSASDAAEQRAKGRKVGAAAARSEVQSLQSASSRDRLCFGGGEPVNLFDGLRYGNLVIYLAGGRSCLRNSCNTVKIKYEERSSEAQQAIADDLSKTAEILLNDEVIATGIGENLKIAKLAAYKQAILLLQTHCYSIKLNASRETIKVEKGKNGVNINVTKESADNLGEPKLDKNNKGYHMMRLMGWTGGGLGRSKQGREEPVGYLLKNNRMGLGSNDPHANLADYRKLIENYVNSDDMRDMQFEPTFSKEERAALHQVASKFGLRSNSYGVGESRRLLITKKIGYEIILTEVLNRRNPKFCDRYFVQVPMQKAHLFPGHVAALDLENLTE